MIANIVFGFILDLLLGDPPHRLHPVRLIGRMLSFLEKRFYRMKRKTAGGVLVLLSALVVVFLVMLGLEQVK
ncbi:MAG: cobalamin biosynthesis protein, partial [Spirochaetota bacterium]